MGWIGIGIGYLLGPTLRAPYGANNVRTLVTSVMNGVPAFYTNCGGGRIESSDIVHQASRPPPGET